MPVIVRTPFADNTLNVLEGFMQGALNASTATAGAPLNLGAQQQVVQAPAPNYTPYILGGFGLIAVILLIK
jgi:hypothetical protein